MTNKPHDPVTAEPQPPESSDQYPSTAPPSPFPWAVAHSPSFVSKQEMSTSYFPTSSEARAVKDASTQPTLLTPLRQPRATRPSQLLLSPTNILTFPSSSPTSPGGSKFPESPRPRTPNGFEFLDWGEGAASSSQTQGRNFDWEVYGPPSPATPVSLTRASRQTFKRRLGPTELSYYLGTRGEGDASGVNDMYLHTGFRAQSNLVQKERLVSICAELIDRHALLGAEVDFRDIADVHFVVTPPTSGKSSRARATELFDMRAGRKPEDILNQYLNGPRTLSDERLAYLVISTPESSFDEKENANSIQEYDFFLFSTHFIGDGMALHSTANEFFTLLSADGPESTPVKNIEAVQPHFDKVVVDEQQSQEDGHTRSRSRSDELVVVQPELDTLAPPMESKIDTSERWGRMAWAGARVEFNRSQAQLIGGQAFAREKIGQRRTIVPTLSYSSQDTKKILATCKSHGVTIASAVFALANFAYIRSVKPGRKSNDLRDERLPMMLYSALNIRPWLKKDVADWYCIAISYYNIILPSFLPQGCTPAQTFWQRAQSTKSQTSKVVKSKWLSSRAKLMALERERRAIGFAREDERRRTDRVVTAVDEKDQDVELRKSLVGLGINLGPSVVLREAEPTTTKPVAPPPVVERKLAVPSVALMGVSMLGNLDGMYSHSSFHGIELHSLNTGSRQRPGALLLFAYTFAGKLWFSLGYDQNGFKKGVIEAWWDELLKGVEEFMLSPIV